MAIPTHLDALISVLESREQAQGHALSKALAGAVGARAAETEARELLAQERPRHPEAAEWRDSEQRAERMRRELRGRREKTLAAERAALAEREKLAALHRNLETVRRAAGRLRRAAVLLENKQEAREHDDESLRKFQVGK
jgi:microsomal dipeptidase-like Zn-dependent dipeptidase